MNIFQYYLEEFEDESEEKFFNLLVSKYPKGLPVYHESSLKNLESIKKHGIKSDYGVFGTIGKPSDFVTLKEKIIIKFEIPRSYYDFRHKAKSYLNIYCDMRYDTLNDALTEHPNLLGMDISFNQDVPKSWIKEIKTVK